LAVSVSAGKGETETGRYLSSLLSFSVGTLTAIATTPGSFLGKASVEARARDLAHDLARAIKEKRVYPATDENLSFYLFMRDPVTREKELMQADYRHWRETGLLNGFEAYVKQEFITIDIDHETRKEWLREMVREEKAKEKGEPVAKGTEVKTSGISCDQLSTENCHELLQNMPTAFRSEAAKGIKAIYQFVITGTEEFAAYLNIEDGSASSMEDLLRDSGQFPLYLSGWNWPADVLL
jgi:hypothetical protein